MRLSKEEKMRIEEQERVLLNDKKNMLVSASAGSGKTYIMIKYITQLITEKHIPVKNFLVLTFTKAAATEMKERLQKNLMELDPDDFVIEQIDELSVSNISTIHAFCEKMLKKYANLLKLNENFAIADENLSQKIKQQAFEKALKKFYDSNLEDYMEMMFSFKNEKNKIRDIVYEIDILSNSIASKDDFLKRNVEDPQKYFEKATDFLFDVYKNWLQKELKEIQSLHVEDFQNDIEKKLNPILDSENLFDMWQKLQNFSFPSLPKRKEVGDEVVDRLKVIKTSINKIVERISSLDLFNDENIESQKNGVLEKILINFYHTYEKESDFLKKSQNLLDFNDLERYMRILSEQESLFSEFQYVFVDEYQDTNWIQEKIVKNIAKNCNFVAVGDLKQGIYGFRQASSDIFLKDMEEFSNSSDSVVNFLKSNFRSSKNVLNFVNDVFKKCMTMESCNVDYVNTSMLNGVVNFEDDGNKSIYLDLIQEDDRVVESLPNVYSVKEAKVFAENRCEKQLEDVKVRINEVLSSKIFDGEKFRKCNYRDIAILSRKRDAFFTQLEGFLQENGIPVVSNSRNVLCDEIEIKILLNYLKIALNSDDDVAMLSVLLSGLSKNSMQEIVDLKNNSPKSLCEIVVEDFDGVFAEFNKNLKQFRLDAEILGINNAFLHLFKVTNYRAYVNTKPNHKTLNLFIDKFLSEISTCGYKYDLAGLINYFETVDITVNSEGNVVEDAVLLTTIHNSKGLEYPIVFLIGCDQSLRKTKPKIDVEINEKFGLALKSYDKENNNERNTIKMLAIKEYESRKDFVEELMIFYVALTRAKNRLYLFGTYKDSFFERYDVDGCDSYFDLIFFAKPEFRNIESEKSGIFEDDKCQIRIVSEIEKLNLSTEEKIVKGKVSNEIVEKIDKYLNFEYELDKRNNFKLKESVTSLATKNQETELNKYSSNSISFGGDLVEIGNAYHLALKVLDFSKITSLNDLENALKNQLEISDNVLKLIDTSLLFENVLILKNLTANAKVYKEKEFMMKDKLCNLLEDFDYEEEILVQGVVDLFVVKEDEIVLVDYKYSNSNSEEYLVKKYKNQLKLYKKAIEKSFKLPINDVYLLSIKNNNLIKIEI